MRAAAGKRSSTPPPRSSDGARSLTPPPELPSFDQMRQRSARDVGARASEADGAADAPCGAERAPDDRVDASGAASSAMLKDLHVTLHRGRGLPLTNSPALTGMLVQLVVAHTSSRSQVIRKQPRDPVWNLTAGGERFVFAGGAGGGRRGRRGRRGRGRRCARA